MDAVLDSVDTELVRSACAGDRKAFAALYQRYVRVVHGILLSRVPPSAAEDLVHDVFVTALTKMSLLRDAAAFPAWLASIARHCATDYHRGRRRWLDGAFAWSREPSVEPEALLVLELIQSLPEAYRETLILRLVEGMTGLEIADRTGLTPESVRVNLHRGMKMLREKLGAKP